MTDMLGSPILLFAGIGVIALIAILAIIKRYKIAGPNEAFILTGRRGKTAGDLSGQKVVTGSGVFVVPFVQTLYVMDLSARRINVPIRGAVSKAGVKLNVDGIAIVKVGGDEGSIRAAAQRFLTQQEEIEIFATEVLSGALRSIVGTLTVEEIIRDRASFAAQVAEVTESALTGQGLVLDTFQIQDVTDADGTYLRDLGRPEQARVAQHASVAEAEANRQAEQARIAAETEVLKSQRELALQQAQVKAETDAAQAKAAAAGPLAAAAKDQEVLAEKEKVAIRQAALTDRELDTTVRKPADANRYRIEQEAEAARTAEIKAAEAKARKDQLTGEGERLRRAALAAATEIEGKAQAAALAAVGAAEASAMQMKADAYKQYSEAAVIEMLVNALPQIARELAAPMGNIDNLTVVSTEGAGALPKTVTDNFTQLDALVKSTLGVDLSSVLKRFEGTKPSDSKPIEAVFESVVTEAPDLASLSVPATPATQPLMDAVSGTVSDFADATVDTTQQIVDYTVDATRQGIDYTIEAAEVAQDAAQDATTAIAEAYEPVSIEDLQGITDTASQWLQGPHRP